MNYSFTFLPHKEKLTLIEQEYLKKVFPAANVNIIEKLGYENQHIPYISDDSLPHICKQYGCDISIQKVGEYILKQEKGQ